jgi:hypothetical protein
MKNTKKCKICGNKIKEKELFLDIVRISKDYEKVKDVCIDCKTEMLYAQIISPY